MGRAFGGQRERAEAVHDQVNVQQLNGRQRRFIQHSRAEERDQQSHNIDRQLKLQELTNVSSDGTTPSDCLHNGAEVVVHDYHVRCRSGNLRSGYSHGQSDICCIKLGSIVAAVTGSSHNFVLAL